MISRSLMSLLPLLFAAFTGFAAAQENTSTADEQSFVDTTRGISLQIGKDWKLVMPSAEEREDEKRRGSRDYDLFTVELRARGSAYFIENPVLIATAWTLEKDAPRSPAEYLAFVEKLHELRGNPLGPWPYKAVKKETVSGIEYVVTHVDFPPTPDGERDFARVYITIRNGEAIWYFLRYQAPNDLPELEKVFRSLKYTGK